MVAVFVLFRLTLFKASSFYMVAAFVLFRLTLFKA